MTYQAQRLASGAKTAYEFHLSHWIAFSWYNKVSDNIAYRQADEAKRLQ